MPGLYLEVRESGSAYWFFRHQFWHLMMILVSAAFPSQRTVSQLRLMYRMHLPAEMIAHIQ